MTDNCSIRPTETTSGRDTFVTNKSDVETASHRASKSDKQSDLKPSQLPLPLEHEDQKGDRPKSIEPITVRLPDVIRMTGLGRSKIYELIASGDIETIKIGRCTLFPVESLHQLIENARR